MSQRVNWRLWRIGRTGPIEFLVLVFLGMFMTSLDAFNVQTGNLALRIVYWLTNLVGGGVIGALIEPVLEHAPALAARPRLRAVAQIVAMTLPITVLVWAVSGLMGMSRLNLRDLLGYFPSVLVVDIVVVGLAWLIRLATRVAPAVGPVADANPLAEQLEPRLGRASLIAVEAEDHYLRVYTTAGEALIYLKFADALQALGAGDGLRTHRSWWVARSAVDAVRWRNGRAELLLSNGVRAPVSRTYAGDVRRTSWAKSSA
jgi:hypothetical protein